MQEISSIVSLKTYSYENEFTNYFNLACHFSELQC
jgi:hypothetical protein